MVTGPSLRAAFQNQMVGWFGKSIVFFFNYPDGRTPVWLLSHSSDAACQCVLNLLGCCPGKRLFKIGYNVIDMFNADRQSDQPLTDMTLFKLLRGQLRMGGRCRMDGQGLGISYIGQVGDQLQAVNKFAPALMPPLMLKPTIPPKPFGRYFTARS